MKLRYTLTNLPKIHKVIADLPDFKNCTIENIKGGVSTEVYKLTDGNKIFYLRIGRAGENMSTEALVHKTLVEKGVKVPIPLYCEDFNSVIERSFMVTSEIPGERIKVGSTATKEVLAEAGRQLALINSVPVKGFGILKRDMPNTKDLVGINLYYSEFLYKKLQKRVEDLVLHKALTEKQASIYIEYVIKYKNFAEYDQGHLSHGDIGNDHIFSFNGHYSGIIDFDDVRSTSVYHDLAQYFLYSRNTFEQLLEGYLEVNRLDSDYMDRIKYEALLQATEGKLMWFLINYPETPATERPEVILINSMLNDD